MGKIFERRLLSILNSDKPYVLCEGLKGLEKESLRIDQKGALSLSKHPSRLGSALTSKFITTDFSEALLEFITPAVSSSWEALSFLCDIHQFTYENIDDELLWVLSMPCKLDKNQEIPLAQYGSSNIGQMKTIYRNGLGLRYGRNMQAIAGIHFNYSLSKDFWPIFQNIEHDQRSIEDFRSSSYMALVRNFKRFGWLVLYLFGSSPAFSKSFASLVDNDMTEYDKDTLYQPYGTSLRMSDLGYTSKVQASINISVNNLEDYVSDLREAIATTEGSYVDLGLLADGNYQQLSLNKLQIENEYYSSVRPKRMALSGERPTTALDRGGVEYVEIRSLDLNAFDPVGINQNTLRFMESFLIYCLLEDSPEMTAREDKESMANHSATANYGRSPNLMLQKDGKKISLKNWSLMLMDNILEVAEMIDRNNNCSDYKKSVEVQIDLIQDADGTPSARFLQELHETKLDFAEYGLLLAEKQKHYFSDLMPLNSKKNKLFRDEATTSILKQSEIESINQLPLNEYLADYFKT